MNYMIDLQPLVNRIKEALKNKKPVLVLGQYGTGKISAAIEALEDRSIAHYYNTNSMYTNENDTLWMALTDDRVLAPLILDDIDNCQGKILNQVVETLKRETPIVLIGLNKEKIHPDIMALINPEIVYS